MLRKVVVRLLLTSSCALVGMVAGVGAAPVLDEVVDGCMMGVMAFGMLAGSVLGSLVGSAIAVPCRGISMRRRILSFVLSPVAAIVGLYGSFLLSLVLVGDREPPYALALLSIVFLLVVPALSLFGFSLPVLLVRRTDRNGPAAPSGT